MKKFYIVIDEKGKGPFSFEELAQKGINRETLVWTEDLDNWVQAQELEILRELFEKKPPPIPNNENNFLMVKAEVTQKKEDLITPKTKVAIAKETILYFQFLVAGIIAGLISFFIFNDIIYEAHKYHEFKYDDVSWDGINIINCPNLSDFPFPVSWSDVDAIRHSIQRRREVIEDKSLNNALLTSLIVTIGLIFIRFVTKGTKWVQETAQKDV